MLSPVMSLNSAAPPPGLRAGRGSWTGPAVPRGQGTAARWTRRSGPRGSGRAGREQRAGKTSPNHWKPAQSSGIRAPRGNAGAEPKGFVFPGGILVREPHGWSRAEGAPCPPRSPAPCPPLTFCTTFSFCSWLCRSFFSSTSRASSSLSSSRSCLISCCLSSRLFPWKTPHTGQNVRGNRIQEGIWCRNQGGIHLGFAEGCPKSFPHPCGFSWDRIPVASP